MGPGPGFQDYSEAGRRTRVVLAGQLVSRRLPPASCLPATLHSKLLRCQCPTTYAVLVAGIPNCHLQF